MKGSLNHIHKLVNNLKPSDPIEKIEGLLSLIDERIGERGSTKTLEFERLRLLKKVKRAVDKEKH